MKLFSFINEKKLTDKEILTHLGKMAHYTQRAYNLFQKTPMNDMNNPRFIEKRVFAKLYGPNFTLIYSEPQTPEDVLERAKFFSKHHHYEDMISKVYGPDLDFVEQQLKKRGLLQLNFKEYPDVRESIRYGVDQFYFKAYAPKRWF